jgi:hypothetical protein
MSCSFFLGFVSVGFVNLKTFFLSFFRECHYEEQAGPQVILLPRPPECWNDTCLMPSQAQNTSICITPGNFGDSAGAWTGASGSLGRCVSVWALVPPNVFISTLVFTNPAGEALGPTPSSWVQFGLVIAVGEGSCRKDAFGAIPRAKWKGCELYWCALYRRGAHRGFGGTVRALLSLGSACPHSPNLREKKVKTALWDCVGHSKTVAPASFLMIL